MADEHHHEVVPNPDYDGPRQHCLPPEVKPSAGAGVAFAILMILVVLGAIWLGGKLL